MEPPQTYYEDEIDLREILRVICRHWRWIAIATVLSAAVALVVSLLLPKQYRASAYVALTEPDVVFQFDPRISTEVETPSGVGIPDLALSDDVVREALDRLGVDTADPEAGIAETQPESIKVTLTGTIVELTIEDDEPETAASFANAWAETIVNRLNDVYAPSSRSQELYEDQTEEALDRWEAAQQALIDFQLTNPELTLSQRLAAQEQELAGYFEVDRSLELVLQDARALLSRLREVDDEEMVDLRDELASLLLTIRSLGSTSGSPSSVGNSSAEVISSPVEVQFQVQGGRLLDASAEENVRYMEGLIESIETQRVEFEGLVEQRESEIYVLQWQLAQAVEERSRLEQERNLALEAYQALARKTQELSLTPQDQDTVARVASRALLPTEPVGPRYVLNTALGGIVGLMLGLAWTFASQWWKGDSGG